eukprot:TRINITY_DN6746_c0_g1_i1.p1 TRINITY_DN6746_c0_g1~~TRINITY_DN6746_c0_g1_i1.p1  ORF type:complete len:389 (+),score=87.83 TRINITY_DN6746_c0_g1_i1:65-1231(+)
MSSRGTPPPGEAPHRLTDMDLGLSEAREGVPQAADLRWRRLAFFYLSGLSMLLGLLFAVVAVWQDWIAHRHFPMVVGGWCACLATAVSLFHTLEHLSVFSDPDVQSRVIRILCMVPIYAITSWLAMVWQSAAVYLDLVRDSYESYALYTFFSLMMGLMGGTDAVNRALMGSSGPGPFVQPWPFCRLRAFSLNVTLIHRVRVSILQFMVLKPLCAAIIIVLTAQGKFGSSFSDFSKGYIYLTVLYNISITAALYGLLYFYIATKEMLKEHKPFYKFLAIKGVIFLSYWQSLGIAILDKMHWLPKARFWSDEERAAGLQDFLICCEMLFFAIAHKFIFGAPELGPEAADADEDCHTLETLPAARRDMWRNFKLTMSHRDMRDDFRDAWNF